MSDQSEERGHTLAEELSDTLDREFDDSSDYHDALSAARSFIDSVIAGLDADLVERGK